MVVAFPRCLYLFFFPNLVSVDCVGVYRHVNLCVSFCVVSQRNREKRWVILCRLPEKGRKEIEGIVEIKERDREERGTGLNGKKQEIKTFPSTLTCYNLAKMVREKPRESHQ